MPLDVAGAPRFMDTPIPNQGCGTSAPVDVGAHEVDGAPDQPVFADLDGDGVLGGGDIGALIGAWGMCASSCCEADLNGDGLVNAADLAIVLAAWNAGAQP